MKLHYQWKLAEPSPPLPDDWLTPLPGLLRQILWNRGHRDEAASRTFLDPKLSSLTDPFELDGMREAVACILEAVDNQASFCIYGDYDVDGVTSVSLLHSILKAYGREPKFFIPTRSGDGYGLSEAGWKRCVAENSRPDVLIAVDCGTSSTEQIGKLREEGVTVVVLDHHEPPQVGLPPAHAIVNPKVTPGGKRFEYLCSAGVVFKLMHALLKTRPIPGVNSSKYLKQYLDLVAVATIADIVPLMGENRLLVRHGLRQLVTSANPGLFALAETTGLIPSKGPAYPAPQQAMPAPSAAQVGFRLGPRLNAAGRMDCPQDALDLLLETDAVRAVERAEKLNRHNLARQDMETAVRAEAVAILESRPDLLNLPVIVLGSRNWHPGIVGIISSYLMRRYHKPTFVIAIDSNGVGKGSGRSVPGISLVKAIEATRYLLSAGGGHEMAAGITIGEQQIEAFRTAFAFWVTHAPGSPADAQPTLHIDAEVMFADLTLDLLDNYELLEPFGNANPQPVLMSRNVRPTEAPRIINQAHLKFFLTQAACERDAIMFGFADSTQLPDPPWDIAFTIDRNTFRGRQSLNISIQAIRTAQV